MTTAFSSLTISSSGVPLASVIVLSSLGMNELSRSAESLAFEQRLQVLVHRRNRAQAWKLLPIAMHVGIDLRLTAQLSRLPFAEVDKAVGAVAVAIEPVMAITLAVHHGIKLAQHRGQLDFLARQGLQNCY